MNSKKPYDRLLECLKRKHPCLQGCLRLLIVFHALSQVHLEVLHTLLFQFQAPFEQMFDDKANVTQVRMQKQAFEIRAIGCGERPGARNVGFERFNIHQKRLDLLINSSA